MTGYFAYTTQPPSYAVDVTVTQEGEYYAVQYHNSIMVERRPMRTDLPPNALWYMELTDGRVFVNRTSRVGEALLLEPSLESILL